MTETKDQALIIAKKIQRPLFRRVLLVNLALSLLLAGAAVAAAFFAVGKVVETSARADIEAEFRILDQREEFGWFGYAQAINMRIPPEEKFLDLRIQWERELVEKSAKNPYAQTRAETVVNSSSSVYLMTNKAGSLVIGNVAKWPDGVPHKNGWHRFDGKDANATPGAIIARVRIADNGHYTLMVGRRLATYDALYQNFIPAMIIIALAMAGASAFFTGLMARRFRTRVAALNARIPVASLTTRDELAQLGNEINTALDEITRLMKGLDAVSQTAAHELNKEIERLQILAAEAGETSLAEGAQALQHLLREILELARIESAPGYEMRPINLTDAVDEAVGLYMDAYEDKGVVLNSSPAMPGAIILGRTPLITNMVANLLSNALKHTPKGGKVEVTIGADDGAVTLSVTDTGPGTDTEDIGELIARGARGPVAGYGFGLRFVQAVAIRHGARVTLKNQNPGLSVAIAFPKSLKTKNKDD